MKYIKPQIKVREVVFTQLITTSGDSPKSATSVEVISDEEASTKYSDL